MLEDFLTDFNTAKPRSSLIPSGTIAKVLVKICPGGHEPNGLTVIGSSWTNGIANLLWRHLC